MLVKVRILSELCPLSGLPFQSSPLSLRAGFKGVVITDSSGSVIFGWDYVQSLRKQALGENKDSSEIKVEVLELSTAGHESLEMGLALMAQGRFQEYDYAAIEKLGDPERFGLGNYMDGESFFTSPLEKKASVSKRTSFFEIPRGL